MIKVLYIEDNPGEFRHIQLILQKETADQVILENAESLSAALECIAHGELDLILLDLDLPDSTGLDSLRKLMSSAADIPIIVLTGTDDEHIGHQAIDEGAQEFLTKGKITGDLLVRAIKYAIWRKSAERDLREIDVNYRTIFENTGTATIIVEDDSIISLANAKFQELTGYLKDEIEGKKRWTEFVVEDDADRMMVQHRLRRENPEAALKSYEFRAIDRSGQIKDILLSIDIIPGTKRSVASLLDITERKQAEDALRKSEEAFRGYFNMGTVGMSVTSTEKGWVEVNDRLCQMLGYSRNELLCRTWEEMTHPEDIAANMELFNQVLAGKRDSYELDKRFIRKDGAVVYASLGVTCQRNLDGSVQHFLTSLVDITERKLAEARLQKSMNEYRALAENSPDMIARFDKQLRYVYVNPMAAQLGILLREEYIGKTIAESGVPEPYCSFWTEHIRTVLESGQPDDVYHSFPTPNGIRYFFTRLIPEKDADGNVETVFSVDRDITDIKRAEETLRLNLEELDKSRKSIQQSHSLLESIMTSPKDIVIFALDREYRYMAFNQNHKDTMKTIWGVDIELGHSMLEYIKYPEDREKAKLNFDRALRGDNFVLDEVYGDQALQRRYYEDHYNPIWGENASVNGLTVFLTDITERKMMEDELRRSHEELEMRVKERTEDLTRKNVEMERFVYSVSHDLRTPLISISGLLGFIEQDAAKGDLIRLKSDLKMVEKAAIKMDMLLMDTLELSRIGRVISQPQDIPFREIVDDALGQIEEEIASKGVKVSIASDLPFVHVDKSRIVEMLVNLISNSIKYRGIQPHPEIEIGHRKDEGEIVFFVRDNGIGIDPSQHDKIFDLFYRIDPKSEGTGVGLTIVKRIIEVHCGRIWIESALGKGCTACFTLPMADAVSADPNIIPQANYIFDPLTKT